MIFITLLGILGAYVLYDEMRYFYFDRPDLGITPEPTLLMKIKNLFK